MRHRVILADDEVPLLGLLERLLESDFDIIATATNGRQLIEEIQRHKPDVAVTDISMPVMNGLDALKHLTASEIRTKFVVCSASLEPGYALEAFRLGAAGYVLKQSAWTELVNAIRAALDGRTYCTTQIASQLPGLMDSSARAFVVGS